MAASYLWLEELQRGAAGRSCRGELDERKKHLGDGKDFQNRSRRLSERSLTHFLSHSQPDWLSGPTRQRQAPRYLCTLHSTAQQSDWPPVPLSNWQPVPFWHNVFSSNSTAAAFGQNERTSSAHLSHTHVVMMCDTCLPNVAGEP